jgi:hypothetical protein
LGGQPGASPLAMAAANADSMRVMGFMGSVLRKTC